MQIKDMTDTELQKLIFGDAEPWELVSMPLEVALEVIECDHFSPSMRDWAWQTIASELDEEFRTEYANLPGDVK